MINKTPRAEPRFVWTDEKKALLARLYPNTPTEDVAKALGVTVRKVYSKVGELGIKKSAEYLASEKACRLRRGDNVGTETRFKPGHPTWNKGMKGLQMGGQGTQFKPGHRGGWAEALYKPIGSTRISRDGYLERKVNDDMPMHRRWRAEHIVLWESTHGPIPAGHALSFVDGNKKNIVLENLALITRAELMRRNTFRRYPKELAQVIQLRGQINKRINRLSKEQT